MPSTYTPIATTTLGSATGTVTFSSIPSTYTDLIAVITPKTTASVNVTAQFNNDTGSNYSFTRLYGDGSSAVSTRSSSQTAIQLNTGTTTADGENIIFQVMNYSNTTTNKTTLTRNNNISFVSAFVGLWRSTSAINRIDFLAGATTFTSGSTFTLYGVKSA